MYTVVSNEQDSKLSNLDIDIVKSTKGLYTPYEMVEMMSVYFYDKMVLDVTAMKNYTDIKQYEELAKQIEPDKVVLFIPEGNSICTPAFMAQLISLGIYNFTTNTEGIKYLLKKSNTYNDVANIVQMAGGQPAPPPPPPMMPQMQQPMMQQPMMQQPMMQQPMIQPQPMMQQPMIARCLRIGIRNVTEHAGATSLIYMFKKELVSVYGENKVAAIEVNRNDFQFLNDPAMISSSANDLKNNISRFSAMSVVLIDLNDYPDNTVCDEVFYLIEPSTIKLNKLIRRNKGVFAKLKDKKVLLNKSLLIDKDVNELAYESGLKFIYNIPAVNDRKRNEVIHDVLGRIGLVQIGTGSEKDSGKIFGLFRR